MFKGQIKCRQAAETAKRNAWCGRQAGSRQAVCSAKHPGGNAGEQHQRVQAVVGSGRVAGPGGGGSSQAGSNPVPPASLPPPRRPGQVGRENEERIHSSSFLLLS